MYQPPPNENPGCATVYQYQLTQQLSIAPISATWPSELLVSSYMIGKNVSYIKK